MGCAHGVCLDQVTVSASKSEIHLRFRCLGEEGEKDRLRFFRTGEPAAEAAEEHGRDHRCDAMRGVFVGWQEICVGGGASCTSADDPAPLMFDTRQAVAQAR